MISLSRPGDGRRLRARSPSPPLRAQRDLGLLAALAGAGLRSAEVISMAVGSVEATERSPRLRVRGKGAKTRVVPVAPEVTAAIAAYLDSRRARVGRYSSTDPLFVRLVGPPDRPEAQAFNRQSLDHLVLTWFRRAVVTPPPGALAHALRHTYATLLVDAGASLPEVQALGIGAILAREHSGGPPHDRDKHPQVPGDPDHDHHR